MGLNMEQLSKAGITANLNYYNALIEKKAQEWKVLNELILEENKKMFTLNTN
jgi:predicted oxidoreductase (fatty acid repression mutant protein)